jgi:hypothetical protein
MPETQNIFGPFGTGVNEVTSRPAGGVPGSSTDSFFAPCISGDPNTGTKVSFRWLNTVTQNLRRAVRGMGVTEDPADDDLILKAIQKADREIVNLGGSGVSLYAGLNELGKQQIRKVRVLDGLTISIDEETGEVIIGLGEGVVDGQIAVFNIPDSYNYNLFNDLVARGFDMDEPISVIATLPTGGILGGSQAFRTGTGYDIASTLKLVIQGGAHIVGNRGAGANGEGSGLGNGGPGGHALLCEYPMTIDNLGHIVGGGGGGARNGGAHRNWLGTGGDGVVEGGGFGAGVGVITPALFKNPYYNGFATGYWNVPGNYTANAAAGGPWGTAGSSAGGGTTGGAAGNAVDNNSDITWVNTGTRLGAINS